jgi:multidrug efflux pump subunit AcrA (membrane-fusion protein)
VKCPAPLLRTAAAAALLLAMPPACDRKPPSKPPEGPATVVAVAATTADVAVRRTYPGTTLSTSPVSIVPRVEGWLVERNFADGDLVEAGQVLYRIDPAPFQASLDAAEARLDTSRADVAVARSEVGVAEARLDNARQEYERNRPLLESDAVSEEKLERLEAEYRAAQAQVEAAKAQIGSAEAAVEAAKADIEIAKLDLSYCTIRSPVAGRTSATSQYVGDLVRTMAPEPLVTVKPNDPLWVAFAAVSSDLPALRSQLGRNEPGVEISLPEGDTGNAWTRTGRIVFIDNTVEPGTAMVDVRVEISNRDGHLLPGTYVDAAFQQTMLEDAVLVPHEAVVRQAASSVVWVVEDDSTAKMRTVQLGPHRDKDVVVTTGLSAGERVVVQGQAKLRDGVRIEVLEPGRFSGSGAAAPSRKVDSKVDSKDASETSSSGADEPTKRTTAAGHRDALSEGPGGTA